MLLVKIAGIYHRMLSLKKRGKGVQLKFPVCIKIIWLTLILKKIIKIKTLRILAGHLLSLLLFIFNDFEMKSVRDYYISYTMGLYYSI